jgi:hypothetical protein
MPYFTALLVDLKTCKKKKTLQMSMYPEGIPLKAKAW